ncbi:diguanylate cyclase [Rhodoferax sp. U11-2br]|uniref:sensor domain-containing diguanylate cyclase n=1 Tax=Rhodoferax sp. U11-2br TaxID=2838878 RepID=UPI001BECC928|nr:diguanylate cyclase [Rhodoferax sp. U11-2br]MBT3065560.1 diguanylate cyclase [Rhodoferax sp. U11-2br]
MSLPGLMCATLFKHLPDGVFLIDPETSCVLDCNEVALKHVGMERSEILNQSVLKLHVEVMGLDQWASLAQAVRAVEHLVFVVHHRHKSGAEVPVEIKTSHFWQDGREYFLSIARNISTRQAQERAGHRDEAQLRYALNEALDGLWDWNLQTDEVFFSPQLARMLGYGPSEMTPHRDTWSANLHPEDALWVRKVLQEHIDGQRSRYNAEYRLRNRNGHYVWVHDRGRVCEHNDDGQPIRMLGMMRNVTDQKTMELTLQAMASHDPLTGLLNRREGEQVLDRQLELCRRLAVPMGMCFFDLDHFKRINDEHGHALGDKVLQRVAQTISHEVRSTDALFRWDSDEFLLLCVDTAESDLLVLVEKLRAKIAATHWQDLGQLPGITCSFGVAVFPDHADNADNLFVAADSALYRAKAQGRNRVEVAPKNTPAAVAAQTSENK